MHHLVVRERQHEVLAEGVDQAEGQLVVVVAAMDRIAREIAQAVVHPAHVPLLVKAQAATLQVRARGAADAGKRGRLLGHHQGAGAFGADGVVEPAQEGHRLQVLAPAVSVGQPLPFGTAVVAVQHRGNRIDAQAIDAEALDPVQGIGDQVVADLVAAEVVDQRVPVLVEALARIGMLVQRGAIEVGQAVAVGRKMRRHPVQDHAQAGFMGGLDEVAEILGRAVARGRREQADRLVAPGAIVGMLRDRQQLEVGEAQLARIGHQGLGQLAVAQPAPAVLLAPGAQVDLVDADRLVKGVGAHALGRQRPGRRQRLHHAGGARAQLGAQAVGIGLEQQLVLLGQELELVERASCQSGQEQLPDAAFAPQPHRVAPAVPLVEVAHHRHAAGIRRPDGKGHAVDVQAAARMGAQALEGPLVPALGQQPGIGLAQQQREAVGVVDQLLLHALARRAGSAHPQAVVEALALSALPDEQVAVALALQLGQRQGSDIPGVRRQQLHAQDRR